MNIEFEIDKRFISILPSLSINLHSKEIEINWIIFGIYLKWQEFMDWIKVGDKLPYKDGNSSIMCLVFTQYKEILCRPYNEYHNCWDGEDFDDYFCDAINGQITHWMELPIPPTI